MAPRSKGTAPASFPGRLRTLATGARLSGPAVWFTCALLLAGCGSSLAVHRVAASGPASAAAPADPRPRTSTAPPARPPSATERKVARVDATSDRILAEGKVRIAAGAVPDAQVRRELEEAKKAGIPLPQGESVNAFERAQGQQVAAVSGVETPLAPWNPRNKPIDTWIVPILQWAYERGWRGTVTSGYRTFYEQAQLNAAGAFSAPAGFSNHEKTAWPGGAVDVTEPASLIVVLRGYRGPRQLVGGVLGPVDPEHFSATGF